MRRVSQNLRTPRKTTMCCPQISMPNASSLARSYFTPPPILRSSKYSGAATSVSKNIAGFWLRRTDLHAREERIDRVTVANELMKHCQLESVDGLSYLVSLDDGLPEIANLESYIRIAKDKAARRRIMRANAASSIRCQDEAVSVDELIEERQGFFESMADEQRQSGPDVIENLPSVWTYEAEYEWLVPDLFAVGTVNLLTAESGDGKSTLTLWLAACIARGEPFLGRLTQQRRVLYVDRENPLAVVKDRLSRMGIPETPELLIWGTWNTPSPEGPNSPAILRFAEKYKPFIVFDNKVSFDEGDEQDAGETRRHMAHYWRLASLGATVMLLHNSGKSEGSKQYRGSSDIKAAVDAAFFVDRTDGSDSGSPLGALRMKPFKHRISPGAAIRFDYVNGQFVTTDAPVRSHLEILEDVLRVNPYSTHRRMIELVKPHGIAKGKLAELLLKGHEAGRFDFKPGRSGSQKWFLKSPDLI